jgi:hypothetical protein
MPRFVVLEHTWNGTHWDLMLEQGGALWTWSLARRPEPEVWIAAGRLPDHRMAYLEYEGPISGNRGSVRRVDAGVHSVIAQHPDSVVVELEGASLRGIARLEMAEGSDLAAQNGWRFRLGRVS